MVCGLCTRIVTGIYINSLHTDAVPIQAILLLHEGGRVWDFAGSEGSRSLCQRDAPLFLQWHFLRLLGYYLRANIQHCLPLVLCRQHGITEYLNLSFKTIWSSFPGTFPWVGCDRHLTCCFGGRADSTKVPFLSDKTLHMMDYALWMLPFVTKTDLTKSALKANISHEAGNRFLKMLLDEHIKMEPVRSWNGFGLNGWNYITSMRNSRAKP